ncbi:pilus assembly protein [Oxalobacteraceae bacterium]|nr:pilus assembly protein [Oxalobacteraceae bacterium]
MSTSATLLLPVCALLSACVHTTPDWDQRFGDATRIAMARQVVAPAAAANADPAAGIDGKAGQAAFEKYQKSFVQPPAKPDSLLHGK